MAGLLVSVPLIRSRVATAAVLAVRLHWLPVVGGDTAACVILPFARLGRTPGNTGY